LNLINVITTGNNSLGFLSFFEGNKHIPFEIKRIYYIHGVPKGTIRGNHAHKNLQQFLWCPYGSLLISLDDGHSKQKIRLDKPSEGLLIQKGIWREMIWNKENSVLCVAASDYYDESDYIRDYDEFLKLVKEGFWDEPDEYKI